MDKKSVSIKKHITLIVFGLVGLISFLLMASIVWQYRTGDLQIDFLITKQEFIHLLTYRFSFYVHIFSSLWVLPLGLILLSQMFLKRFPKVHRLFGKIYVVIVLGLAAPSGLFMSLFANGGMSSKINFVLLSVTWWLVTYLGYKTIRAGKILQHKRWMMRSVALSYSAITLRFLQVLLSQFAHFNAEDQYLIASVLSWTLNLMLVELVLGFRARRVGHFGKLSSVK